MSLPSLYTLGTSYVAVMDALLEAGGEVTDETHAALNAIEDQFEAKVERVALAIRIMDAEVQAVDSEIKRLADLKARRVRAQEGLKGYLLFWLRETDTQKVEGEIIKVRRQKNSRPSIRYEGNLSDLPESLVRTIRSFHGDAAYEAWKADPNSLPESVMVERGEHVRIT